jgi:hypothetical protein
MNKRIKKLAREAGLLTYNPDGQPTKLEKFAELIISECADWIDRQDETRCPYGIDLVEHFGVEK